jgi:4-aminobutyrate aminotransferase-like enzyme
LNDALRRQSKKSPRPAARLRIAQRLFIEPDGSWPIVWERAKGVHVWDADGKKYLDLTAAFGVAAAGHANPRRQGRPKADGGCCTRWAMCIRTRSRPNWRELSRSLSSAANPPELKTKNSKFKTGKTIFCNSGFEAVEAALKTAMLATKRRGVIAFTGAYHGLGYGALNATHRDFFRGPFQSQLREFGISPVSKSRRPGHR